MVECYFCGRELETFMVEVKFKEIVKHPDGFEEEIIQEIRTVCAHCWQMGGLVLGDKVIERMMKYQLNPQERDRFNKRTNIHFFIFF